MHFFYFFAIFPFISFVLQSTYRMQESFKNINLSLEAVRVTEAAALAAAKFIGTGDEQLADQSAVLQAHNVLNNLAINGIIRVGEGMNGDQKKLYIGENIGLLEGPKTDIAILALEGKSIVARGGPNPLSCIALAESGGLLNVPEMYMDKLVVGPGVPVGTVDLDMDLEQNISSLAKCKNILTSELVVCTLDRPRHNAIISKLRNIGVKIRLIQDGDVSGAILTSLIDQEVDMYLGVGAAPQGVLTAAALQGMGGWMQGRLLFKNDNERYQAEKLGINKLNHKYESAEMAMGDVTFAATGVTYGAILKGVRVVNQTYISNSLVVRSNTSAFRYIEAHHDINDN